MHRVGFEPTRLSPSELETDPLDHSGICALNNYYNFFLNYLIKLNVKYAKYAANNCGIINITKSDKGCFFAKTIINVIAGLKLLVISENK